MEWGTVSPPTFFFFFFQDYFAMLDPFHFHVFSGMAFSFLQKGLGILIGTALNPQIVAIQQY